MDMLYHLECEPQGRVSFSCSYSFEGPDNPYVVCFRDIHQPQQDVEFTRAALSIEFFTYNTNNDFERRDLQYSLC